jgi:hypothetical protein
LLPPLRTVMARPLRAPAVTGSTFSTSICAFAFGGTMYVAPS